MPDENDYGSCTSVCRGWILRYLKCLTFLVHVCGYLTNYPFARWAIACSWCGRAWSETRESWRRTSTASCPASRHRACPPPSTPPWDTRTCRLRYVATAIRQLWATSWKLYIIKDKHLSYVCCPQGGSRWIIIIAIVLAVRFGGKFIHYLEYGQGLYTPGLGEQSGVLKDSMIKVYLLDTEILMKY